MPPLSGWLKRKLVGVHPPEPSAVRSVASFARVGGVPSPESESATDRHTHTTQPLNTSRLCTSWTHRKYGGKPPLRGGFDQVETIFDVKTLSPHDTSGYFSIADTDPVMITGKRTRKAHDEYTKALDEKY